MRSAIRSLSVIAFAIACVFTLGWSSPLAALVQLLGTTALVMGGTEHPLVNPLDRLPDSGGQHHYGLAELGLADETGLPAGYVADAVSKYIRGAGPLDEAYNVAAVWTPETFWPFVGSQTFDASVRAGVANLDLCVRGQACTAHVYPDGQGGVTEVYAVFAYSQSARIASLQKASLINEFDPADPGTIHHATFVMIANPNRPNGGILQMFKGLYIPILDISFDGASPTDSPVLDGEYLYPTADIARQYDAVSDFPIYPLNLLADLNVLFGAIYLHGDYFVGDDLNPVAGQPYLYQGQVGDTNYYMIATKRLPILLPLAAIGVPDPVLAALDAPLRVLIEWGYDRDIAPGVPTTAQLFRAGNPIADLVRLAVATLTGLDDAVSMLLGDSAARPFGTAPVQSTFGVGGNVLPTTTEPVAPTTPPASPPAVEARMAPVVEAGPGVRQDDQPAGDGSEVLAAVESVEVSDAYVPQPVAPQSEAPEPEAADPEVPAPKAVKPVREVATEAEATDRPEPARHRTAPHRAKRHEPTSAAEATARPEPARPRHRMTPDKVGKSVAGESVSTSERPSTAEPDSEAESTG